MEVPELMRLTDRQLTDILMQADKILEGRADEAAIEEFSKYSKEFTAFLKKYSSEEMIVSRLEQIPVISYNHIRVAPVMMLVFPYYVYAAWFNYNQKMELLQKIRTARGIYSSIQFLNKSLRS